MQKTTQCAALSLLLIAGTHVMAKKSVNTPLLNGSNQSVIPATIKINHHTAAVGQPLGLAVDIHGVINNGVYLPYKTYTHTLNDFATSYLDSNPRSNLRPYALTWNANKSQVFALSREDEKFLISIDPDTGVSTRLSRFTGFPNDQTLQGMAIDENNICFVVATDNMNHDTTSFLYQCDFSTGVLTLVGSQGVAPDIHDIAATCDGELYGVNTAMNELVKIDKNTGAATIVGDMGIGADEVYSVTLTYDRQNGVLYQYVIDDSRHHTALAKVSKTTGLSSYVSDRFIYGNYVGGIESSCADQVDTFAINPGFNGSWYNPETSGQGLMLDVFQETNLLFVTWFTFDQSVETSKANIGSADQRWYTASGELGDDNTVELTLYNSSGGVFNAPDTVETTAVGSMNLTFEDCVSGSVEFNLTTEGISGTFPIQRIAGDNIGLCESLLGSE